MRRARRKSRREKPTKPQASRDGSVLHRLRGFVERASSVRSLQSPAQFQLEGGNRHAADAASPELSREGIEQGGGGGILRDIFGAGFGVARDAKGSLAPAEQAIVAGRALPQEYVGVFAGVKRRHFFHA